MRASVAALGLGTLAGLAIAGDAAASGPREFPDHGGAAFARGGAWLAVGTDPLAAHYNPAAMATARSGVSLSFHLPFNKVCYDRRNVPTADNPEGFTGPRQGTSELPGSVIYQPVCNEHTDRPGFVPALGIVWRVLDDFALGLSVVPPSAYGTTENDWPELVKGYNLRTGASVTIPAPYRYMTLGQGSLVLFPTLSAGYEIVKGFRIGAGFIWGVASVDSLQTGLATTDVDDKGDHAGDDSRTRIEVTDAFIPGFVASVHASPWRKLDVAGWYRWLDKVRSHESDLTVDRPFYDSTLAAANPICASTETLECPGQAIRNPFTGTLFEFTFPMEARIGVRYHEPRNVVVVPNEFAPPEEPGFATRDPLRDDVFDVELDLSWTNSSGADTIVARFPDANGEATLPVKPQGLLPPNGDEADGYHDTFGVRLGTQYNVLPEKLGLMLGGWVETAAADDAYLNVDPVAALRGGFGGGLVVRQDAIDITFGYQRHWNVGYDNGGDGATRAVTGTRRGVDEPFRIGGPLGDREFRSYHVVNGGRVTQSANVFEFDMTLRF